MNKSRLLVWHTERKQTFFSEPSEITFADPVIAMNLDGAIAIFQRRAPDQSRRFTSTQLAQLMGASYATVRQLLDCDVLPIAGDGTPRKGRTRYFSWGEGLIVALIGAYWRQNVDKAGLREIGRFLAEHVEDLVPAAEPVEVN